MKTVIEKPDGSPYLTFRKDEHMAYIRLHDYEHRLSQPVEIAFDIRTVPAMIEALQNLSKEKE